MKQFIRLIIALAFLVFVSGIIFFGYRNGRAGEEEPVQSENACPHGLTEATCAFCDETLIESLGFCTGHGVPEAFCTRCNSSLIVAFQSMNDWCAEHDLPESQCTICNPESLEKWRHPETTDSEPEPINRINERHLLRNHQTPALACATENLKVQFSSPQTAEKAGLQYEKVVEKQITETVTCNVEIAFNGNQSAHLSPLVSGIISRIHYDVGDLVKKGEILAFIDSSEFGMAKAEYLRSHALVNLRQKNFVREKRLLGKKASSESDVLEAETKLIETQINLSRSEHRLKTLGISEMQIAEILVKRDLTSLTPLTAPFDGVLIERNAVTGEVVDPSHTLFIISDTTLMWAILDIYETDISKIKRGQSVVVQSGTLTGEQYTGPITWISSHIDPRTRTAKARVELANPGGFLKAGAFATARILVKEKVPSLIVSKSAVQWEGCCNVVFIAQNDATFQPRKIKIEYDGDSYYAISGNVYRGDTLVTTGSFLLKTEILKGSIGAGCCEIEPGK